MFATNGTSNSSAISGVIESYETNSLSPVYGSTSNMAFQSISPGAVI